MKRVESVKKGVKVWLWGIFNREGGENKVGEKVQSESENEKRKKKRHKK